MNIYRGFEHRFERAVVTVGSFDGVHSGHRRLIERLAVEAEREGAEPVVVTFSPHPRQLLRGENRLLSTIEEKLQLLKEAGARNVVVIDFTVEFSKIDAVTFAVDYLRGKLGAVAMMVGGSHNFGRGGKGNSTLLEECGLRVIGLGRLDSISSTMVRDVIESGDMLRGCELLAASYLVITPLSDTSKLLPPEGEYLCEEDGAERVMSVAELRAKRERSKIFIKSSHDKL